MDDRDPNVIIEHPNREKAASKATKAVVLLLLLGTAALVAIVTIGGWAALEGAKILQIVYILLYLVIAYFVARWNRGVLPVAAALAIVLLIFAAVAGPEWFARDKAGFTNPALNENVLGLVTFLIVPGPDLPDRVRDARVPAGLERRGRALPRRFDALTAS